MSSKKNRSADPIIVVGGGLGGLSVALALGRQGHAVQVLEQAVEISPIGYGIQLGPNVFDAFDRLEVSNALLAVADTPPALTMPDAESGETLLRVPLQSAEFDARWKRPYVVVHRADIHKVLLDACEAMDGVTLTVNATFTGYTDLGEAGVEVRCEDGRVFKGAALICADGIKSRARTQLAGEDPLRPTGYVAHRTIFDIDQIPLDLPHRNDVVLWSGPGYHLVHYPLRKGTLFNAVAVFKDPGLSKGEGHENYKVDVDHVYANAQPLVKQVIAKMDLERRWHLSDRDPIRRWSQGRVTLLGDAVHPTLQSYAQGAGMAIEDALCLADLIQAKNCDYAAAFAEYQRTRLIRTARIQLGSRELWEFYHAEGIAREVRNAKLTESKCADFYDCLSWIWNGDPALKKAARTTGALAA